VSAGLGKQTGGGFTDSGSAARDECGLTCQKTNLALICVRRALVPSGNPAEAMGVW
jgi:hypothetical protein